MSVEIPMDPLCSPPPAAAAAGAVDAVAEAPPAMAKAVHVLISPIVPVAADGASATALPPAYTGVLYLDRNSVLWQQHEDDPNKKREMWFKDMRGWLMVLAVLAASVTYQAGLNPPGGFWQEDDKDKGQVAGTPVLQSTFPERYDVFFYFNATAFVTSVVIIILLMNESFYHSEVKVEALEIIVVLDMVGLMGAYIAGCTRTVSSSIYIIVLTVVVFLYVVYAARFLPKLWGLFVGVPCVHDAAQDGKLPKLGLVGRSKSAPPP